jgi:hypothetical protein
MESPIDPPISATVEMRWRCQIGAAATQALHLPAQSRAWWSMAMLSDKKSAANEGVKPANLEGHFAAHPAYAHEAAPLIEADRKSAQRKDTFAKNSLH